MKKIAFYLSDRRESIVRSGAIIATLLRMEAEIEIHVKLSESGRKTMDDLLNKDERLFYYILDVDEGFSGEEEREFFLAEKIGLVISDLCPWIHLTADELRIKSILISDFTWDQFYGDSKDEETLEEYRECYECASKFIVYDTHMPEMETLAENVEPVSFVAFPYDMDLIQKIQSQATGPVVFLEMDTELLLNLEELPYYFICEDEKGRYKDLNNVFCPDDYVRNMHNYIAASEYVIARPRWDTAAYALLANKKAAYCPKENDLVGQNRILLLKERDQCIDITEKELRDIRVVIERLDAFSYNYDIGCHNDDYEIAGMILDAYPKKRKKK